MDGLESGKYQMVFAAQKPDDPHLYYKKCAEEQAVFLLPCGHPLADMPELGFKDLNGETMLVSADTGNDTNTGKLLIAYFSWSGTSEKQAQAVAAQTGGDLYRIERQTPYSSDYSTVAYGEAKDEADANARPSLLNPLPSIDGYAKVVLCYPIWWHTAPMTVGTFLETYDWSGKTIYPISQSASMSVSQYEESLTFIKGCARNAVVDNGLFTKSDSEITDYINNTVLK